MKTITCPNPECAREHGLFWYVTGPKNKQLMYRCNHIQKQVGIRGTTRMETRSYTQNLPAPAGTVPDESLPEEWCPAYRKTVQGQQQRQFILMNQ